MAFKTGNTTGLNNKAAALGREEMNRKCDEYLAWLLINAPENIRQRIPHIKSAPQSKGRFWWLSICIYSLSAGKIGEEPTRKAAILAQCCECLGYYQDGRHDCECPSCPLYYFMPYRAKGETDEVTV